MMDAKQIAHDGDRTLPAVNGQRSNKLLSKLLIGVAAVAGLGLIYKLQTNDSRELQRKQKAEQEALDNRIGGKLPPISPRPAVSSAAQPEASSDADPASAQPGVQAKAGSSLFNPPPAPPAELALTHGAPTVQARNDTPLATPGTGPAGSAAGGQSTAAGSDPRSRKLSAPLQPQAITMAAAGPAGSVVAADPATASGSSNKGFGFGGGTSAAGSSSGSSPGADKGGAGLGNALQPTRTAGSLAGRSIDRSFLLAKGAFLGCTLETRLDSTVPGMTSCILTRNVYSDNGKLLLLERGSKLIGEYQGGLTQGHARIFVLWSRIQTPHGVMVNLDSPGTDALGASGLDGHVDNQWGQKLGAAMLLSLIDDAAAYASRNKAEAATVTLKNTSDSSKDLASQVLESTVNIPPILVKNHGDSINIYVARDLDFRGVYGYQ